MNILDGKDCYKTEQPRRGLIIDSLLLKSRWSFYLLCYLSIARSGFWGLWGKLTVKKQVQCSSRNLDLIEQLGGKWNISGLKNLDKADGAVMLIGNHMSMLETAAMPAIIAPHLKFTFVIKKTLMLVPFMSSTMRAMQAIPITRTNPREDFKTVLKEGKKLLNEGVSIAIFPQGTRTVDFNPDTFSTIGVKLAKAANAQVIPFALKTDFAAIKGLGKIKRNNTVCFAFGEPINVTGNGKEAHMKIIQFIENNLNQWKEEQKVIDEAAAKK
ncbi:lysophospholipid acyltransferase family protein [Lentisphaerota bacterium WC36G]|nr:1-acyl-sn-glycerol-3-phosphate acyltransferase [Lentisphaerae bacterium WC36]